MPSVRWSEIFHHAVLVRLGGADQERVSFVHRRFNEYFVAQGLIRHPERIRLEFIPTDSQWRDALVLYCEVSDEPRATAIANFCWKEVRGRADRAIDQAHPDSLRTVHSLRFLYDAFRARRECLAGFRDQLESLLARELSLGRGLLAVKIVLEATGLLRPESTDSFFAAALETGDPWLSDTALRTCRQLPKLSRNLERKLIAHIASLPLRTLLARRKELLFSLGLSDAFASLYRFTWLKCASIYLFGICITLLIGISPFAIISIVGYGISAQWLDAAKTLAAASGLLWVILSVIDEQFRSEPLQSEPWREVLKKAVKVLLRLLLFMAPLIATIYLVKIWPWLLPYVLGGVLVWGVVLLISEIRTGIIQSIRRIRLIRQSVHEWRLIRVFEQSPPTDRARIESELSSLQTRRARLRYVERLSAQRIKPTGTWSQGLPYLANDPASTRLAQLEERWLGLADR